MVLKPSSGRCLLPSIVIVTDTGVLMAVNTTAHGVPMSACVQQGDGKHAHQRERWEERKWRRTQRQLERAVCAGQRAALLREVGDALTY